ncbi:MAG: hypothetical protein AAB403_21610, partial [Planctomycetota bacterium]
MDDIDQRFAFDRVARIDLEAKRDAFWVDNESQDDLRAVVSFLFAESESSQLLRLLRAFET